MDVPTPSRKIMEIIDNSSYFSVDLSQFGNTILSVELLRFKYDQGTSPGVKYLGICLPNCKETINQTGHTINCLKTIHSINGVFQYQSQDDGYVGFMYGQGPSIDIGFVVRDSGSLTPLEYLPKMAFTNEKYILELAFELQQY